MYPTCNGSISRGRKTIELPPGYSSDTYLVGFRVYLDPNSMENHSLFMAVIMGSGPLFCILLGFTKP